MKAFLTTILLVCSFSIHSSVLDRILATYRKKAILLSEMKAVQKTLPIRRKFFPEIYRKPVNTIEDLTKLAVKLILIRETLYEKKIVITDKQVTKQIESLNIAKEKLFAFLKKNGLTPKEYFEIIRSFLEYNIFFAKTIKPRMIAITEQNLKNAFYGAYYNKDIGSSRYNLIRFVIKESHVNNRGKTAIEQELNKIAIKYVALKILPNKNEFANIDISFIKDVIDTNFENSLKLVLRKTNEHASTPFFCGQGTCNVFFIVSKNLLDPTPFNKAKKFLSSKLREEAILELEQEWLNEEMSLRDYIRFHF